MSKCICGNKNINLYYIIYFVSHTSSLYNCGCARVYSGHYSSSCVSLPVPHSLFTFYIIFFLEIFIIIPDFVHLFYIYSYKYVCIHTLHFFPSLILRFTDDIDFLALQIIYLL